MDWQGFLSWMCRQFLLPEAVLLLRNNDAVLEVVAQHGLSQPICPVEFLEWAEKLAALRFRTPQEIQSHSEIPLSFVPQHSRGVVWNSPTLAVAPVLQDDGEMVGLLVLGGRPARLKRVTSVVARACGMESETQRLRQRLDRLERVAALGELVYHVAHEINNPLTTVVGYAELLADRMRSPLREPMHWLKSEAERSLGIARNVLSLARGQEEKKPSDLNVILHRALSLREYALRVAGVEVHTELAPDLPPVEINPGKMQQALLNIVINAEQALETVNGPRILWLRTSRGPAAAATDAALEEPHNGQRQWVQVEIYNNGPAIPEAWLGKIFEPFFTSKPAGVGTGLGLAIARSAADSAGGEISAANENGGVLFRLRLPTLKEPAASLPGEELFARPASLRGRHLLVVEDEPPIAQLIQDVFQAEGCRVNTCGTAEEALDLLERHRFDALLSDLKLPGKGGRWLFQQISKSDRRLAQKTLFITGDTVSQSTVAFLRASGQPALAKPFHLRELKAAVEHLLQ